MDSSPKIQCSSTNLILSHQGSCSPLQGCLLRFQRLWCIITSKFSRKNLAYLNCDRFAESWFLWDTYFMLWISFIIVHNHFISKFVEVLDLMIWLKYFRLIVTSLLLRSLFSLKQHLHNFSQKDFWRLWNTGYLLSSSAVYFLTPTWFAFSFFSLYSWSS